MSGLIRRDEHQDFQPLLRVILHSMLIAGRGHNCHGPANEPKMRRHASVGISTTGTNADCRLSGLIRRDEHQDFQPLCRVILHSMLIAGRSHGALARSQHLLV